MQICLSISENSPDKDKSGSGHLKSKMHLKTSVTRDGGQQLCGHVYGQSACCKYDGCSSLDS